MAVLKALIRSPYLEQPANFNEGNKWMHYIKPLLNVNLDGSFTIWLASFLFFIQLKQVVEKCFNSCCFTIPCRNYCKLYGGAFYFCVDLQEDKQRCIQIFRPGCCIYSEYPDFNNYAIHWRLDVNINRK